MKILQKNNWCGVLLLGLSALPVTARADVTPEQLAAIQPHLDKGVQLLKSGAAVEAIGEYSTAVKMVDAIADGGAALEPMRIAAHRGRGQAYVADGDWKKAVADFDLVLKTNPNDVESLIGRGEADTHFGPGLFATVKEEPEVDPLDDFAAALKIDPKSAHAYVARGRMKQGTFIIQDDLKKAMPDYEKAIEVDPTYADAYFRRAIARDKLTYKEGSDALVKSDLDRAIALNPTRAEYFRGRAEFLNTQPKATPDDVIADYSAAIKLDPKNPENYSDRAAAQAKKPAPDTAQMLADYAAAIQLWTGEIDVLETMVAYGGNVDSLKEPSHKLSAVLTKRGDLLLKSGKVREALNDYNAAFLKNHDNYDAIAGRGEIMVKANKPEMAIQEISARVPELRARDNQFINIAAKMLAARAKAFIVAKRFEEALIDLNGAIQADSMPGFDYYSQQPEWYFLRAFLWQQKGDDAHALTDLNVAAKLDPGYIEQIKGTKYGPALKPQAATAAVLIENPDSPVWHKLLGNEWAAAGEFNEAISEFKKAVALDEKYADGYNNLGLAQMQIKQLDAASASLDKAILLKADDPRFYINRSVLRLNQGRFKDAVNDAEKATQLDPQNLAFWNALATAQQANGEYSEAEVSLNAALKLIDGKGPTFDVRVRILTVRALQDKTPTKEEMDNLFFHTGAKTEDVKALAAVLEAEVKRHPDVAALNAMHDAVVIESSRKQPMYIP